MAVGAVVASAAFGAYSSSKAAKSQEKAADRSAQVQWDMYNTTRNDQMPWMQAGNYALQQIMSLYGLPYQNVNQPEGNLIDGNTGRVVSNGSSPQTKRPVFVDRYGDGFGTLPNNLIIKPPNLKQPQPQPQQSKVDGENIAWAPSGMAGFQASPGYQFRLDEGTKALDRQMRARGMTGGGAYDKALTRYAQGVASDEYNNYTNNLFRIAGFGPSANQTMANVGQNAAANIGNAYQSAGEARASGYLGTANTVNNALNNYMMYQAYTG